MIMIDLQKDTCLTKTELIGEILETVSDRLWESADDKLIMEVAQLIGIELIDTGIEGGLFWKKGKDTS
tara:strand:- start:293 stop:496 length:204 start_codon:yes stop_codon:yes gene_type:complete